MKKKSVYLSKCLTFTITNIPKNSTEELSKALQNIKVKITKNKKVTISLVFFLSPGPALRIFYPGELTRVE